MGSLPKNRTCSVEGCDRKHYGHGYCTTHHQRMVRGLEIEAPIITVRRFERLCVLAACENKHWVKGLCRYHSEFITRHPEDPMSQVYLEASESRPKSFQQYFLNREFDKFLEAIKEKCQVTDSDCWEWQGGKLKRGYAIIKLNRDGTHKAYQLHRIVMEATLGRDLGVETVHHICANRGCVNPEHLQLISNRENVAEMMERNFYLKRIAELEKHNSELLSSVATIRSEYAVLDAENIMLRSAFSEGANYA